MKKIIPSLVLCFLLSSCGQLLSSNSNAASSESNTSSVSDSSTTSISDTSSSAINSSSNSDSSFEQEETKAKNITNFLGSDQDIYRINISTENGVYPVDKETYIASQLTITEQNVQKELLGNQLVDIKLRGNSTLEAPKKAFRLKFKQKVSMFGLQEAKSWVLLANFYDKSNIRNYLAYLTANKMTNLYYQPSSIFVDVYINNEYQGLYLLTEQIQTGKGRVDIEEETNGDILSSMFELDFQDRAEAEGTIDQDYFMVNGRCFSFKYPEMPNLNSATLSYIKNYMQNALNASTSRQNYETYIDVDSFIDFYLIQELFKNADCGNSSIYYYLPANGKLTAGPVWDFDIGLNTVGDYDPYFAYQNATTWAADNLLFNRELLKDSHYKQKVKTRYLELKDTVLMSVFDECNIVKEALEKAQNRNVEKWTLPGELETYISSRFTNRYRSLTTVNEHYTYVEDELAKRFIVLDNFLL